MVNVIFARLLDSPFDVGKIASVGNYFHSEYVGQTFMLSILKKTKQTNK